MYAVKSLLALIAVSAWGAPWSPSTRNLRIAWMGTSITCGLGASSEAARFTVQVEKIFERRTRAKIVSRNFCFGGAHSLLQVALLKTSVLPWKPDVVIAELGTLDELYKSISLPSIEAVMRLAYGAGVPLIALYPYTTYADVSRVGLHKLGDLYGDDVIDMVAYDSKRGAALEKISNDGCHPNDQGQALIADAFEEWLKSAGPWKRPKDSIPNRMYGPDLSGVHFQPILPEAGAERVRPRLFDGHGYALKISAEQTITQKFNGSLVGLLFQFNCVPGKISYRIDSGGWSGVQIAPEWFLNYVLKTDLPASAHSIQLRIAPKPDKAAVLEGLLVN